MKPFFNIFLLLLIVEGLYGQSNPNLIPFTDGEKWGYTDSNYTIRISLQFENAFPFENHQALILKKESILRIDTAGKTLDSISSAAHIKYLFDKNLLLIRQKESQLYGLLSLSGHWVLEPGYKHISTTKEGNFNVLFANETGVICHGVRTANREWATQPLPIPFEKEIQFYNKFTTSGACKDTCKHSNFINGLALYSYKEKYGFVNEAGKIEIPFEYKMASTFRNGLARVATWERIYPGHTQVQTYANDKDGNPIPSTPYEEAAVKVIEYYIDCKGRKYLRP